MTRFGAIFVKVDGLDESEVGNSHGLAAETLSGAEDEALSLPPPPGANFVKIFNEGRVVRRLGFALDA